MNDTTVDTEAILKWADQYLALLEQEKARVREVPEFQEWAAQFTKPWTIEDSLGKWIGHYGFPGDTPPPGLPSWVVSAEVSFGGYNEMDIRLRGEEFSDGDLRVGLGTFVNVEYGPEDRQVLMSPPTVELPDLDDGLDADTTLKLAGLLTRAGIALAQIEPERWVATA